jgi:hypothetical protein
MVSKPKYEDVLRQMPLKTPQFSQSIKEFGDVDTCALRKFAIHRDRVQKIAPPQHCPGRWRFQAVRDRVQAVVTMTGMAISRMMGFSRP